MSKFKNVNTGVIVTETELNELHEKEYSEMWSNQNGIASEFETKESFIAYMKQNDIDTDFELVEE